MREAFLRNEMLLGPAALAKLARSHVCVVGLGGVGGHAAEALTRAGLDPELPEEPWTEPCAVALLPPEEASSGG